MKLESHFESQPALGWLPSTDERRRDHPMRAAAIKERTYRNWLLHGPVTDQGSTSECVAYSFEYLLRFHPVVQGHREPVDKNLLYREAQKVDYWAGEGYDGTSVDAGAKILRKWGYITGWTWAWDAETVMRHVINEGPVVVGTRWTMDMFRPDKHGYIYPGGQEVGGHAYLIRGGNLDTKNPDGSIGVGFGTNSWGDRWGRGSKRHPNRRGHFNITLNDLDALIKANGEACAAIEKRPTLTR